MIMTLLLANYIWVLRSFPGPSRDKGPGPSRDKGPGPRGLFLGPEGYFWAQGVIFGPRGLFLVPRWLFLEIFLFGTKISGNIEK